MLLNLSAFNEALERKYGIVDETQTQKLNESLKLDEKFDDSMPKWLKDRIGYTQALSSRKYKNSNSLDNKYPNQVDVHARQERGNYSKGRTDYGLGAEFLNAGVDLNKVKIIEAPVPAKVPITNGGKRSQNIIPIFLFDNGQVWAKGINDRERWLGDPENAWDSDKRPFSKLKNSEVIENAVGYAYIDLDTEANGPGAIGSIQQARAQLKQELGQLKNYNRRFKANEINRYGSNWKGKFTDKDWEDSTYDKSGYEKINKPRYKKIADDLSKQKKYKNLPDLINNCEQDIEDYRRQLISFLEDADLGDWNILDNFNGCISILNDAYRGYLSAVNCLNSIDDVSNITNNFDQQREADRALSYMDNCRSYLNRIERNLGDYFKATADWLL